jgi:hypothetical protein
MSLKTRPSADGESPLHDPWSGMWGSVVPDVKSLSMLRVELPAQNNKQETHAFAYSSLSRWSLRKVGEDEELEICFSKFMVKVRGRRLGKLLDPLDEGRLKILKCCPREPDKVQSWIQLLTIVNGSPIPDAKTN